MIFSGVLQMDRLHTATPLTNLTTAESLLEQGLYEDALQPLQDVLAVADETNNPHERYRAHRLMVDVYKALGDTEQALAHYEALFVAREQVFNMEGEMRLRALQAIVNEELTQMEADSHLQRNLSLIRELETSTQLVAELDSYAMTVAHDLKSPISVIIGFSELLLMDLEGQLGGEQLHFLKEIVRTANNMSDMVYNMLSFARARKHEMLAVPTDLRFVLEAALNRLAPACAAASAEIRIEGEWLTVLGQEAWLVEVFANLMSNALKYGGSPPMVVITGQPLGDGRFQCSVSDNGCGLTAEAQERLFVPFERLGQTQIEGHGLGLSIVKTIIDKLDGSMSVSSSGVPGQGATFSFILPLAA